MKKKKNFLHVCLFIFLFYSIPVQVDAQCNIGHLFTPVPLQSTVCSGTQLKVTGPSGFQISGWVYRDSSSGAWTLITNYQVTLSQTLNTTKVINREYRMLFSNVGCGVDSTGPVTVTIIPYAYGNNNVVLPSLGVDTICSGLLLSCALGKGNYEIEKWIFKDHSDSLWTVFNMTGGYEAAMQTRNTTGYTTRQVRALLRAYGGACRIDTSASRSFVIKPKTIKSSGTRIPEVNHDSICAGSVHKVSWGFASQLNYLTMGWLYRDNGTGVWNEFASGGGQNYDSSTLVANRTVRQYRVVYEDYNTCSIDTTASASIIITRPVYRTIPLAPNVKKEYCADENYVSVAPPLNYNGTTLKILKQVNDTGSWVDISSGLDSIPAGINTVVKWSYRIVFFNSQACTVDTSQIASTRVIPRQYGYVKQYALYTKDSAVCAGKSVTISIPGNTTKRYWYMQENDTSQIYFIGYGVKGTDVAKNLMTTVTRSYMALIDKPSGCGADTTARIRVVHRANAYGKTGNTFVPYLNQSNNCSDGVAELYVTLPNTYTINKWIYKDVGTNGWYDVPNATSNGSPDDYFNPTANASRMYKAVVKDNERCLIDSTLTTTSYKRVWTFNTDTSLTLSTTTPDICSGGTISIAFSAVNTTMRGYVWSDNGTSWNYSNQTSNPINTSFNTSVTNNTIRTFKVVVRNLAECRIDTSAAISVLIKARQGGVNPNATVLTSGKSACVGETVSLSAVFGLGIKYKQWIYRDGPSQQWVVFSGSTGSTANSTIGYIPTVTNRDYRVVFENDNSCTSDTTSPALVLIYPLQGGTATSLQPTSSKDQYCSGSPVTINAPTGTTVQKWFYTDSTNVWSEIPVSGTSYSDPNTEVTQNVSRKYRFVYKRTGTCFIDTSMERVVTLRAITNGVSATTPTVLSQQACSDYPVEIYHSRKNVNEVSVESWIYSDDGFKWKGMVIGDYSVKNSSVYEVFNTSVTKNTMRYYRMIMENRLTCSYDSSREVKVFIKPLKGGYAFNITPIMPSGAFCNDTFVEPFIPYNSPGVPLFWEYQTANQPWIVFGKGNSGHLNNNFSPTKDVFVRLTIYNQQNCSIDTSNVVQTMVAAPKRGNNYLIKPTVTSTQICTNKTEYVTITVPLSPLYSHLERCIYRDNNGPWQEIKYEATLQYGPPEIIIKDYNIDVTVPTVRAYKVLLYAHDNQCMIDTSDEVSVNLLPPAQGYLVNKTPTSSSPTYISGNTVKLSISSISGYTIDNWVYTDRFGTIQTTFLPSNTLNFDDVNTFTDSTYGRNYYAVFFNNTTCSYDTTNKVTVTLASKNQVVAGTINVTPQLLSAAAVCSGDSIKLKVNLPAGYYVDQWLFKDSLDNVWRSANVLVDTIMVHVPVFVSSVARRFYRVILTDSITRKDSSLTVAVTINPTGYRKNTDLNISGNSTVCKGSVLTLTGTAGGSTAGTVRSYLKWLYRNSASSTWEDINATSILTDDNTLSSGFSRDYVYIQYNFTTCTIDTSNEKMVNISGYSGGALNASYKATVTLDSVCSSGGSISITSNTGANTYGWQFRDNYTNPWFNIYNAKSSSFTHSLQITATNKYRQYRPLTVNSTCLIDTGLSDTILIKAMGRGRITTITPTASGSYCSGSPVSLIVNPGSGNTLLKWLFRNDSTSAWSVLPVTIANNASDYNTIVNTTVTRQYCVVLRRTTCSEDTSNSVSVTIRPFSSGANSLALTPASGSLCAGAQVTLTVVPGSNKSVEKWIYRDQPNATWSDLYIGNTTTVKDYNTNVSTSTTRYYRTLIFNSLTCSTDTSSQASVTISPTTSGTITDTPKVNLVNVCARGKATLQYKPANGTIINWLVSVNNSAWRSLALATDTIYTDSLTYISVPETRKYRVVVRDNTTCSIDTTREIVVNYVLPQFTSSGSIALVRPDSVLCAGLVTKITCNLPSNKLMYDWMYKDGINGSWNRVVNPLSSYTETGSGSILSLTSRYYRALIFDPLGCTIDSSQQVYVVYKPSSYTYTGAEILSGVDSTCSGNTVTISVPYKAKKLNLAWLMKSATGLWEVFNNDSLSYLTYESVPDAQPKTITFRTLRIDSATCAMDSSVAKSVKFRGRSSGFTNDSFYTSGSVCGGTPVTLNYTGSKIPYLWEYRDSTGSWQAVNPRMATMSYALDDLTKVSVNTTRKYRLIVLNNTNCRLDSINEQTITITPLKTGNSSLQPSASAMAVCAALPVTVSLSSVQIDHWIFKDNNGSWQRMTQGNSSTVTDYNTNVPANVQRSYRGVIKSSSTCSFDTSTSVTVNINKTVGSGNSSVQTQTTRTTACSGTSVQLSVPGSSKVVKWLYRDSVAGTWTVINSTSTIFNDSVQVTSANVNRYYRALLDNTVTSCSFDTTIERMVTFTLSIPGTNTSVVPSSTGSTYCSGAVINLQVNPGSNYQLRRWYVKNNSNAWMLMADTTASSVSDISTIVTTNTTRQYRVLMYNASNCNQDTSGSLAVTIKPVVRGTNNTIVPVASKTLICAGTTVQVSVSLSAGTVSGWLLRDTSVAAWNVYAAVNPFTDSLTGSTNVKTRMYRVLVSNNSTCAVDTSAQVSVSIIPKPSINHTLVPSASKPVYCSGETLPVQISNYTGNLLGWTYRNDSNASWISVPSSGLSAYTHTNTSTGVKIVRQYRASFNSGCENDSSGILSVTIDAIPPLPVITRSGDSLICNITGSGFTYKWKRNGTYIAETNAKFIPAQSGNYVVEVANSSGCQSVSVTFNFIGTFINRAVASKKVWHVYPNPSFAGKFRIETAYLDDIDITYEIFDSRGQRTNITGLVKPANGHFNVDLSSMTQGMYFIRIKASGEEAWFKLLFE